MRCAVYGCSVDNKKKKTCDEKISFHSFPKESKISKQWAFLCGRKDKFNLKTARVCSNHFIQSDFVPINPLYESNGIQIKIKRIKQNAVPSLSLPLKKEKVFSPARTLKIQNRSLQSSIGTVNDIKDEGRLSPPATENDDGSEIEPKTTAESLFCAGSTSETDTRLTKVTNETLFICKIDCSTQTDPISPTYSELQNRNLRLSKLCMKQRKTIDAMSHIFTSGQIKKLERPDKRAKWSENDIANAIAIHAASPQAYRLLLKKSYPLPAVIALKKWCAKIKDCPGITKPVLSTLNKVLTKPT